MCTRVILGNGILEVKTKATDNVKRYVTVVYFPSNNVGTNDCPITILEYSFFLIYLAVVVFS